MYEADEAEAQFFSRRLSKLVGSSFDPQSLFCNLESLGAFKSDFGPIHLEGEFDTILPPRFANYLGKLRTNNAPRDLAFYPDLQSEPLWEASFFPISAALEANADDIREEIDSISSDLFQAESENIGREGEWDVILLFERGRKNTAICNYFPKTVAILENWGAIKTHIGLAYFSRLKSGTRIAPHCGPTNMRLRCHLGLKIPKSCGIKVGGLERSWTQGKVMVFDDSFEHEVWNEDTEDRVVLVLDVWHPDLTHDEISFLTGLQQYVQQAADGLSKYWARNEESRKKRHA